LKLFLEALHHALNYTGTEIGSNEGCFEFFQEGGIGRMAKQPIQRPANGIPRLGEPIT